jgi:hypothetical protein
VPPILPASQLARHLGVTEDDMREARQAHLVVTTHSLDAPVSYGDDPGLLGDILGEDDPAVAHATDIEAVRAHLDELPEREQRILIWRFYGNLTQSRISDRLGNLPDARLPAAGARTGLPPRPDHRVDGTDMTGRRRGLPMR